ncbi:MAG TPA: hypothetical protein VMW85_04480 [Methanomassiliicoccales archaeon]|nr:hypothetical protein [Methanomassiliicoccales archaeon]
MTNVTIRGIDDETYLQFSAEATLRGMPIGDLTTQAMKALLEKSKDPVYRITNLDSLKVSRNDLESIDGTVIISNIDQLEFEEDVDWAILKDRVQLIENVDRIVISKKMSKFQILTKARNVDSIVSL